MIAVRPWLALGVLHLVLAALAGAVLAAPFPLVPRDAPLVLGSAGVVLLAMGFAYGFASPFLKREILSPWPARLALALVLAGGAALLLARLGVPTRLAFALLGAAYVLVPLHLVASALLGPPWRGGVALFDKDQPFRHGDLASAIAAGLSLAWLAAAGALLLAPPFGLSTAALGALLLGFAPAFFTGVLVFLLPRNAKHPMPGLTLVLAALAIQTLAAFVLVAWLARPRLGDLPAWPAPALLLAAALAVVAFARIRIESPGPQLRRARPFLRGAAALAILAALATTLSFLGGANALLPLAALVQLALAATLAVASGLLGAPILLNAVPRDGRWGAFAAGLGIAGLFLLAPAFQYPRPAFPGAVVLLLATLLVLWGAWPMRKPRRDC